MPRAVLLLLLIAIVVAAGVLTAPAAHSASPDVVVSQVYAGGGNSGAPFANDFVELFNRGSTPVDVSSWTIQYASAGGTTWQATALTGSIAPGRHYLVQLASAAAVGAALPTPDATGTTNMAVSGGKVAVVRDASLLTAARPPEAARRSRPSPTSSATAAPSTTRAAGPAPAIDNTTAASTRSRRVLGHRRQRDRLHGRRSDAAQLVEPAARAAPAPADRRRPRRAPRSTSTSSPSSRSRSSDPPSASGTRDRRHAGPGIGAGHGRQQQRDRLRGDQSTAPRSRLPTCRSVSPAPLPSGRPDRRLARGWRDGRDPDRAGTRPARGQRLRRRVPSAATLGHAARLRLAAPSRPGGSVHGDRHLHGDRSMRRAAASVAGRYRARARLGGRGHDPAAARPHGDAGARRPRRDGQRDRPRHEPRSQPGRRRRRHGPASRSISGGRPRIVARGGRSSCGGVARSAPGSLRARGRREPVAHRTSSRLPMTVEPGDHDALVLLTTRPRRGPAVAVRMRIGVVVVVRAPGRVVRRLALRGTSSPHGLVECGSWSCSWSTLAT